MNNISEQKLKKLPVREIIIDAFRIPWMKRAKMLRVLSIWGLGIVVLQGLSIAYTMFSLPMYPLLILFVVTCHRIMILGDNAVPHSGFRKWTRDDTMFFGWGLAVGLIFVLAIIAVVILIVIVDRNLLPALKENKWAYRILAIPATYLMARLSVGFPATAVGRRPSLSWAWKLSRGNGWRLVVVVGLLPWFFAFLRRPMLEQGTVTIGNFIYSILTCIFMVIEVSALSFSYKVLTQNLKDVKSASSPK